MKNFIVSMNVFSKGLCTFAIDLRTYRHSDWYCTRSVSLGRLYCLTFNFSVKIYRSFLFMKKILTLLVITTALSLGVYAQEPVTQFRLVQVLGDGLGVLLRGDEDIAHRLRRIGFKVSTNEFPSGRTYTTLKASRKAKDGTTSITVTRGYDDYCIIDFASKAEVSNFVNSMRKAKYKQEGTLFSHPKNDWGKICVRVSNRRVKIICPSHTVPDDF